VAKSLPLSFYCPFAEIMPTIKSLSELTTNPQKIAVGLDTTSAELANPRQEMQRMDLLPSYNTLDSLNKLKFDNITRLAARMFDVPIVLVCLLEENQFQFKSLYGVDNDEISPNNEIFGYINFSSDSDNVFFVSDATQDRRFSSSPLVTGDLNLRFLASAPLISADNLNIGTFCIIDTKPRDFSPQECETLVDFATLYSGNITYYRNEAIFNSLIENGSELTIIFHEDGSVIYESPSIERHVGYQASEILGTSIFHLIHPEDRDYVVEEFQNLIKDPTISYFINFRFLHKNGHYIYLECIGLNRLDDKAINGIVVNARDITERIKIEEKLQESESRFKTAFEKSSLGMALVSAEGHWLRTNIAVYDILGYTEKDLQELTFQALTHPDDLAADIALMQRALTGKISSYSMEKRYRHRDGHYLWCELNVALVRDINGKPNYFISQIQNITERKKQEHQLRLLESVAVNATDSILITESNLADLANAKIIYANKAFTAMTGYEEYELLGKTPDILYGSQTSEEAKQFINSKLQECSPYRVEFINYRKDGTPFWVEISFAPIADDNGTYTHWVTLARDITNRKNGETLLEQARQQAEQANAAKSEFLSRMSHEFRTPLNAILGFAQLLETAPLQERDQQSVGYILKAGQHLLELVNEVLDISRIESGHLKLDIEPVRIADIAIEMLEWVRPLAAKHGIQINFNDGQHSILDSPISIDADSQRLRQILLNLISNALKFNRPGGSITLGSGEVFHDGRHFATLSVTDTGFGISAQQSELLFQPFERLSAERDGIEGSGIGLALSMQLTKAMGGNLKFHSTPESGSTFWIELPVSGEPVSE
jgi:PAS domain S-box-containing protein